MTVLANIQQAENVTAAFGSTVIWGSEIKLLNGSFMEENDGQNRYGVQGMHRGHHVRDHHEFMDDKLVN